MVSDQVANLSLNVYFFHFSLVLGVVGQQIL